MPEERKISIAWAIPAILLLGLGAGLGLILAVAREEAPEEIELQEGDNIVRWTKGPTMVEDALAGIIDYVETFYILGETWIEISRDVWDTWAIARDQICRIVVDRACTVSGFVWVD